MKTFGHLDDNGNVTNKMSNKDASIGIKVHPESSLPQSEKQKADDKEQLRPLCMLL